jgi:hypothetical protein
MVIDWGEALAKQASLVRQMSQNVLVALAGGGLTPQEALEIDASVRRCAANFDRIASVMDGQGAERSETAKAEAIRGMWRNLSRITADRLRRAQAANEENGGPLSFDEQA